MSRALHRGLARARLGLLGLCGLALLLAVPSLGQASEVTSGGGNGAVADGISGGLTCFIEPWYCEGSEPECLIEPWECVEEEPEGTQEFGRYIVVFWDWVEDPAAVAHEQVEKYGGHLGFVYEHALKGYSAEYPTEVVDEVESEPTVRYVEEDQVISLCEWEPMSCEETGSEPEPEPEPEPEAEPEPEPEPTGLVPVPIGHGGLTPTYSPADTDGADNALKGPPSKSANFVHCGQGEVHRYSRCVSRRGLARRVCRKRKGAARNRCVRRTMRKPNRIEIYVR